MIARPFRHTANAFSLPAWERGGSLGLLLGLMMPLLSAWIYPTYRHNMQVPLTENLRLLEVPFVICELLVIGSAIQCGLNVRQLLRGIAIDCRIALAFLLAGVWGSTLFVSKVPAMSILISVSTVVHLLFAASVAHLIRNDRPAAIGRFAAGMAVGLVALLLLTAWRFLLPPPLAQVPGHAIEWSSALPGFISVRHFGAWTGGVGTFFAAAILNRRRDCLWTWHEPAYFLAAILTIWSGTRAAVLAMALSSAIAGIGQRQLPDLRMAARLTALTLIALVLNELLPHPDSSFLLFHSLGGADTTAGYTSGRTELWTATFSKWLQAPWFGWGSGSTFWEVNVGWSHTQPHNFVLQFLISWGLVGASGGIWLLGRATIAAHRRAGAHPQVWPLNAMLYALLIQACLEGMLHYPRFIMTIMALFAMIFHFASQDDPPAVAA